jgi:hypothetical protein
VTEAAVIAAFIVGVFAFDFVRRWWRENEWKRRWKDRGDD